MSGDIDIAAIWPYILLLRLLCRVYITRVQRPIICGCSLNRNTTSAHTQQTFYTCQHGPTLLLPGSSWHERYCTCLLFQDNSNLTLVIDITYNILISPFFCWVYEAFDIYILPFYKKIHRSSKVLYSIPLFPNYGI